MTINPQIILGAKNQTSRAFQSAERDVRRFSETTKAQFQAMEPAVTKAALALTAVGAGGLALVGSSALLAARVETLGIVMEQVGKTAGYTAEKMHEFAEGVAKQGITTRVSRQAVIRLIQANLDLSKATDLARIAQDAAVIGGINSSEAFERMIHGIVTLNPLILRKLGIIVNLQKGYKELAAETGRASTELSGMEKQSVALTAVMQAGERITGSYTAAMETAGKKLSSLPRHIEEAKKAIGEAFLPFMGAAIDAVTSLLKAFNKLEEGTKQFVGLMLGSGAGIATMTGPLLFLLIKMPGMIAALEGFSAAFFSLNINIAALGTTSGFVTTKLAMMNGALAALATAAIAAVAIIAVAAALAKVVQFAGEMADRMAEVNEALKTHERVMFETAETYAEYYDEMVRVGRVSNRMAGTTEELEGQLDKLRGTGIRAGSAVSLFRNAIVISNQAAFMAVRDYREMIEVLGGIPDEMDHVREQLALLAPVIEENTMSLEEWQEVLAEIAEKELNAFLFMLNIDISQALEGHQEKLSKSRDELAKLGDEMSDLTDEYKDGSIEFEEYNKKAGVIKDRMKEITGAIDKESEAWERNTAQIIFNMAQRALSEMPMQLQLEVLPELAKSLGLVDERSAAAWKSIGDLALQLEDGTIESWEFNEAAGALADTLFGLGDKDVTLTTTYRTVGAPPGDPSGLGWGAIPSSPGGSPGTGTTSGQQEGGGLVVIPQGTQPPIGPGGGLVEGPRGADPAFQAGGRFRRGQPFIAGDGGMPELVIPDRGGTVMSGGQTQSALGGMDRESKGLLKDILEELKNIEPTAITVAGDGPEEDLDGLARDIMEFVRFRKQ